MNEIVNFIKEMFTSDKGTTPIGLCAFECVQEAPKPKMVQKKKREMRLSELMDK